VKSADQESKSPPTAVHVRNKEKESRVMTVVHVSIANQDHNR
jgi:hypothetical protein